MITKINVTTSATLVSAARKRRFFALQNQSDVDIFVAFTPDADEVTGAAGAKPGLKLEPGEPLLFGENSSMLRYANDHGIHAIHEGSGDKVLVLHEI
jgi:hypothetical protein